MNMLAIFVWFSGVFCGYRWQKLELPDSEFESRQNKKNYLSLSLQFCLLIV